ncbi:MAG: glycoside hydrolase family 3 C-terminal domain-containing protein [Anaerolineae bacterium]
MERIESLLKQMTLQEKISLLAGADLWRTVLVPRLGIPTIKTTDGPLGARGDDEASGPTSGCFPGGAALAATWNPALVEQIGHALAEEVKSKGANILLAPTVNIHRSPVAGRNFECFSEDPYLTARMAIAYINGLQNNGVGACIKHLCCNDSEFERNSMSSEVGERALHEIYLRPFQIAIREAKPWAVMSSYNRVNGVYSSENDYLLKDILKGEWNYDGIVISDWYGTYSDHVPGGGLDLEMPGPARWMGQKALEAVQSGQVSEAVIDDKVRRILRTLERAGVFEHPNPTSETALNNPAHPALVRKVAAEAIVLLKNANQILPLKANQLKQVAVIGSNAKWAAIMGGGSARVTPHYVVSPLNAIQKRLGAGKVKYALGCPIMKHPPTLDGAWLIAPLKVEYFGNRELSGAPIQTAVTRKTELVWFGEKLPGSVDFNNYSVRLSGAFRVPETDRYQFSLSTVGKSRLLVGGKEIIRNWDEKNELQGREGLAEMDLEAGQAYSLTVEFSAQPGPLWRNIRLGCMPVAPANPIAQAVALAKESDVAIVFAGLTAEWESEGFDRPDMELPGEQKQLIEAVAAANPNTVVVLNAGSPLAMDWLGQVKGVLQAWYLGQETGNAMADVLFGDVNPSGKLPTTFPKRLEDTPAYINYPGENGKVVYGEGLFVGYRYYDKRDVEPLFPFGYGLSYTTFAYRNLSIQTGKTVHVSVQVQNTGDRAGQEIVQLYIHDKRSRLHRPEKELKAFAKVTLEPGESKTATFTLDHESFEYYDPARKGWVAESGEFEVLVGASSRDIRGRGTFHWIQRALAAAGAARLNKHTPLKDVLENPGGRAVLEKYFGQYLNMPGMEMALNMSLNDIASHGFAPLTVETMEAINADLMRV